MLSHPKAKCRVLMFPDASDLFWGSCVTQVPAEEMRRDVPVEEMSQEPLGFVSGVLKGSELRWPTVDKEAFAVVSTFKRLDYLLWNGVDIFCDHRNLAYIFHPGATGKSPSKAAAQRLQGWGAYIGQFRYSIVHIPGAKNSWGDLLSRWVKLPGSGPSGEAVRVCYVQVPEVGPDPTLPDKQAVKQVQAAIGAGAQAVDTPYGTATVDAEGLLRVVHQGRRVLWIPEAADELKKRLLVCAHMKDAGHRGVDATLERLRGHCVWSSMEDDVKEMVRDCLFCADYKTRGLGPRPLSDSFHGTQVNAVVHFDVLYLGKSEVADGVDLRDGFVCVFVC